jgi:hypothetical protein
MFQVCLPSPCLLAIRGFLEMAIMSKSTMAEKVTSALEPVDEPIEELKLSFSSVHPVAHDFGRQIVTYHYLSHVKKDKKRHFYQGVIYDSPAEG